MKGKQGIVAKCTGLTFRYSVGGELFICEHRLADNVVMIVVGGTTALFVGELVYASAVDTKLFFDHWLSVNIEFIG